MKNSELSNQILFHKNLSPSDLYKMTLIPFVCPFKTCGHTELGIRYYTH